jgi:hypothetical protein
MLLTRPSESDFETTLQLLEKITRRARNINSAWDAAFAVFDPLHDARGLAALGAIRALGSVHDLLAVRGFCDFGAYCHDLMSPDSSFFNICAAQSADQRMLVDKMSSKNDPELRESTLEDSGAAS